MGRNWGIVPSNCVILGYNNLDSSPMASCLFHVYRPETEDVYNFIYLFILFYLFFYGYK